MLLNVLYLLVSRERVSLSRGECGKLYDDLYVIGWLRFRESEGKRLIILVQVYTYNFRCLPIEVYLILFAIKYKAPPFILLGDHLAR